MIGRPVVGRTFEHPNEDRFYFLEQELGDYAELHGPLDRERKFSGYARDFRDYGEALTAKISPHLERLPLEQRYEVQRHLVAQADREWGVLRL